MSQNKNVIDDPFLRQVFSLAHIHTWWQAQAVQSMMFVKEVHCCLTCYYWLIVLSLFTEHKTRKFFHFDVENVKQSNVKQSNASLFKLFTLHRNVWSLSCNLGCSFPEVAKQKLSF